MYWFSSPWGVPLAQCAHSATILPSGQLEQLISESVGQSPEISKMVADVVLHVYSQ